MTTKKDMDFVFPGSESEKTWGEIKSALEDRYSDLRMQSRKEFIRIGRGYGPERCIIYATQEKDEDGTARDALRIKFTTNPYQRISKNNGVDYPLDEKFLIPIVAMLQVVFDMEFPNLNVVGNPIIIDKQTGEVLNEGDGGGESGA